ncbi:hypothetical protein [Vibrio sp. WXL210]|uniref:hypothetical protein n=1 Tax=Vibrio sp. WXL210 TaxID=3450709 RepID=UPI003EC66613
MDLKQFVKEALVQITEGVQESQKTINISGGDPAPLVSPDTTKPHLSQDYQSADTIDFSVALHIDSIADGELIVVDDKLATNNSTAIRVRFQLPLNSALLGETSPQELEPMFRQSLQAPRYNEVYLCY